jgi:hypothetical protein
MSGSILYASNSGLAIAISKRRGGRSQRKRQSRLLSFLESRQNPERERRVIDSSSLSDPAAISTVRDSEAEKQEMRKSTKRLLGGLAVGTAAVGTIGAVLMKTRSGSRRKRRRELAAIENTWARPGMSVIFRAEVMPGRETSERTFRVDTLLPSGRVLLEGAAGEHTETEFEKIRR